MNKIPRYLLYLLFALNVFLFGSSWMFNKMVLNEGAGPFWAAALRQSVALCVFLIVFLIKRPRYRLSKQDKILIVLYGLCMMALAHVFSFIGQQTLYSGLASIIFSFFPLAVLIISFILIPEKEPLSFKKVLGSLVGLAGIFMIYYSKDISRPGAVSAAGIFFILAAVFVNALPNVLIKRDGRELDPLILNTFGMLVAVVFLIPLAFIVEGVPDFTFTPTLILSELYLGIFCSAVAFFLYFWLLQRISVFKLSLSAYLTPFVAIVLGAVFFAETLSINHYIGMLLILTGISITGIKHAGKTQATSL
jgi:drug/metabolite transporter (DMT)-like permease